MIADHGDVAHVEVQLGEDDLGEGVLHARAPTAVEGLRIAEQFQSRQEERLPGIKLGCGVRQLSFDLCSFSGDGRKFLLELGFGPAWFADEVEVVFFFGVQLVQAGGEAFFEGVDAAEFVEHGVVELVADHSPELVAEAHRGVVLFDGFFDVLEFEVGLVAGVGLSASAHEVEVGAAVAFAWGDDESFAAASAPDESFEPVVMVALPGAASAA